MLRSVQRTLVIIMLGVLSPSLLAEVPVVDASSNALGQSGMAGSSRVQDNRAAPISAGTTATLLYQLQILQQEVQELRGIVEQQAHLMGQMREEQRDRYLDLDRRITLLGKNGATAASDNFSTQKPLPSNSGTVSGGDEKSAYQAAFDLIRNKRYDDAITALSKFVNEFPNGSYTGNAYYWLGEVQLVKADHQAALAAFGALLDRYPTHRKVPDAKYKLGKTYRELGDQARAKQLLREVVEQHAGTSAAKLAEAELRNLSL